MNYAVVLISENFAPLARFPLLNTPIYSYVYDILVQSGMDEVFIYNDDIKLNEFIVEEEGFTIFINGNLPFVKKEFIDKLLEDTKELSVVQGVLCIKNSFLNKIKDEYPDIDTLVTNIKVIYSRLPENIKDLLMEINDFALLSQVEMKLRRTINEYHMNRGVYIENPDTVSICNDVTIEPGAMIRNNTCLVGRTIIKKGCIIGPNTEIHESFIDENTTVTHSLVLDSRIGKGTTVGPFTHIRMNSKLGDHIRAGNFIEIKNSVIANNTKMSHLSYIGDTDCGSNVNWGCGCVTVNYDGVDKHRTTIGNNVFIGCNTNLIAPVVVGDNIYIAAGSTITDNIPTDAFAIARAHQVTKEGYAKKYFDRKKDHK